MKIENENSLSKHLKRIQEFSRIGLRAPLIVLTPILNKLLVYTKEHHKLCHLKHK